MKKIVTWAALTVLSAVGLNFLLFVGAYVWLAAEMTPPNDVVQHAGGVRVIDKDGGLITESLGGGAQRIPVKLNEISPDLVNATIAVEDASFWRNYGINVEGIATALYENIAPWKHPFRGRGGSSISQQLAKNLYISEGDRTARDPLRKLQETIFAIELNRRYSKEAILEWYLNEIFYGNFAVGAEAASLRYFGKNANELSLPEAALLAGLPQAPAVYDPLIHFDKAKHRQETVLDLMARHGYLSPQQAEIAKAAQIDLVPSPLPFHAAHVAVLAEVAAGLPNAQHAGVTVQTTLDLSLQSKVESSVARHITADIAAAGIDNAAVVVIDPQSGRIVAMVGSAGFLNQQISGQVNNALSPNQPAGAMTPFIFLSAFKQGWLPMTKVKDSPYWLVGSQGSTVLGNVDGIYRGDVTVRGSLSESLIVPAVRALQFAGTDETEELGRSMGLDSADEASRLGEGYAAGYANVSLVQLTGAYAVLANEGVIVGERSQAAGFPVARPYVIESVAAGGDVVWKPELFQQRVVSAGDAYLVTNILSRAYDKSKGDNPVFARPAAFFSGLSDGNRDAWAVGYTRQFAIGVWVGRADNSPNQTGAGVEIARAIWQEVSAAAHQQLPVTPFDPPSGIQFVLVCDSGKLSNCPSAAVEVLPADSRPVAVPP